MPTRRCAAQHRYGGAQLWLLVSRSLQPKRKRFRNDRWTAWIWCVPCLVARGGVLTGYIGISIEKVLFVLLTLSGKVPSAQGDRHIYHSRRLDLQNCLSHACDLTVRPARTVVHWRGPVPVGMRSCTRFKVGTARVLLGRTYVLLARIVPLGRALRFAGG